MAEKKRMALVAEVPVSVNDVTWTIRLDFNALAEFEEKTGKSAFEELAKIEAGNGTVVMLRHFVWSCLRYHHPDVTLGQAGDVLSADPQALSDAIQAAFDSQAEGEDAEGNVKAPSRKG